MEQSFADLLSDAFSETPAPSFTDGDLDFESLHFIEEDKTGICAENLQTEEDEVPQQEATSQTAPLFETEDANMEESDDEGENFQIDGAVSVDKTLAEDYTSSEENDEEDDAEDRGEAGDLSNCGGNKEVLDEGRPLDPQGAENPQDRNEERGDKEVFYFERVPECGGEMVIKGDGSDDDEEETEGAKQEESKLESEDMKIKKLNPYQDDHEFPEISMQNLQDLLSEVESEDFVEKVVEFSGEEHQEGGESFADYPSDFSSCEYMEETPGKTQADAPRGEDTEGEGDELEGNSGFRNLDEDNKKGKLEILEVCKGCEDECETDERDSSSSSADEEEWRSDVGLEVYTENLTPQENSEEPEETQLHSGKGEEVAMWSTLDDHRSADLNINWNLEVETLLSDFTCPAENDNSYVSTQREDSSNQGYSEYGFFFNSDVETPEVSQQRDDDYEDDRNWEQEKERIQAFYKFYDDSDNEEGKEGRQTKVQFSPDPLSQVICYETDSDRESLSSSTDVEEDLSSADTSEELQEPEKEKVEMNLVCDPPKTETPEDLPDLRTTPVNSKETQSSWKHKWLDMLKLTLKMAVVILMGLIMFWFLTDQN